MANFEAFHKTISSSINLLFMKSGQQSNVSFFRSKVPIFICPLLYYDDHVFEEKIKFLHQKKLSLFTNNKLRIRYYGFYSDFSKGIIMDGVE